MKNNVIIIFVAAILLILGIMYFSLNRTGIVYKKLPILGNHRLDTHYHGDAKHIDTLWHVIPEFSFINQSGETFTEADVKQKIYVVDFFFTTCKTICPAMSKEMSRVHQHFINENRVLLVSHTVDPETDQPEQLSNYAASLGAREDKWIFLTGDKAELYNIARKGYMLEASVGSGGKDDFIHTQNFALIDHKRRVRGVYDGLDPEEISMMIKDMQSLIMEME